MPPFSRLLMPPLAMRRCFGMLKECATRERDTWIPLAPRVEGGLQSARFEIQHEGRVMPRYRFAWANISSRVLNAICADRKLKNGSCVDALMDVYGVRPKVNFVQDNWPVLRETWLARDGPSREAVTKQLRALGLGATDAPVRTARDQLDYLRSCHNQQSLREIVLSQFLAIGEMSPNVPAAPAPPPPPSPEPVPARATSGPAPAVPDQQPPQTETAESPKKEQTLIEFVQSVLRDALKQPDLARDKDGDIPIRMGSSMCFVRAVEEPESVPFVRVYAILVKDLPESPELLGTLNEINLRLNFAKLLRTPANEVVMITELPAQSLSADQLMWALRWMNDYADHLDTQLAKRFGGKKWFEDEGPTVNV